MTTETNNDKPCGCDHTPEPKKTSRRDFLLLLGFGLNAIAGAMIGIPLIGYLLSTFFKSYPLQWISLGPVTKFPEGTTRLASYLNPDHREWDGQTAEIPCWVRRIQENDFQVFAINCTHLGCPVRWFEESKLFMCPCHGGAFYENGEHAAGPPPRGLYEYPFKVENNELFIQGGILPTLANPMDDKKPRH
ncbi:Rieske Fe-S protein [Terrimicrobium sacchariphilum]|jgi:nitrite reductase/ring-hydroxylating ferredoxin subunit|uniref:Rieske Fe-S protein n=1 Tax=Terrimicrobium sacchariphilum TaxID=690879 RepID=A0A146GAS2_TERSA|nr:Rieske (2Fe-2S) protein [Terrimicrobium sacchariphilum]GAT34511.1 Rieske Fe-S protein [Terrimicrobium sacchariphilum]